MASRGEINKKEIQPVLSKKWDVIPFVSSIENIGTFPKVKTSDCFEEGTYPVVDQSEKDITGYINNEELLYKGDLPIIIFGDHTRNIKYVDFPFAAGADGTKILHTTSILDSKFFYYYLKSLQIPNLGYSRHYSILKLLDVPVPSLNEQKQIAEKLDKLFDQIETIKEASNKIPELLKNFRQQVLTYAVTGKLTNSDFAHWEKSTIGAIGKVKGGKRLPKGEELVNYNTGYPYIRARDLKEGTVLKQNIMYLLPETQEKIKNYIVKTNDVYITIVGAKIGDAGIIPESMNNANLTENAAKITDLSEKIMPQYLSLWLQAPLCQSEIQQSIKSAAQGKLALTRINSLSVCFPPIESQKEIIDKVEYLLGELKIIESKFYQLQNILEKLPQALLCKAFKGELL